MGNNKHTWVAHTRQTVHYVADGIETGEEIYWCYGSFYWRRWKPRLPLYPDEEDEDGAEEGEGGEGGETTTAAPRCRVATRCE